MKNYKIIACDLDGTLLNNASQISDENIAAINELDKRGVFFVPCSGRTISEIPKNIRELDSVRYIIHSNGSAIFDKVSGKQISISIPKELNLEIFDLFRSCEAHVCFRSNGSCFVDAHSQSDEHNEYYNVCHDHCVIVREFAVYEDDLKAAVCAADDIEVFSIFFHDLKEKQRCKEYLSRYKDLLRFTEVTEYNLEIFNIDAGKGNALYKLADLVGVPYSETMSIGDSDNDRTVTAAAGLGLAVANASDSLKSIADEIICSNEEHVIDYVLKKYF